MGGGGEDVNQQPSQLKKRALKIKRGRGVLSAIFEPKTLSSYLLKKREIKIKLKKKKKMSVPGGI